MRFVDHELCKFLELDRKNYITIVHDIEDGPLYMVPLERVRGLDKVGLLSLMYMPHFGCTTKFNTCVKQLLVCFHGVFLCLD